MAEFAPPAFENEAQFVCGQGSIFVGEADSAVQLRVAAELFFNTGHADQDQSHVGAVVLVAKVFQSVGTEAFGFIDVEQVNVFLYYSWWPCDLAKVLELIYNCKRDQEGGMIGLLD